MKSLLLDRTNWDLCKDADGNIAVASEPYSLAQDVACACRLFRGELWYDTTKGIPYFEEILGHLPPAAVIKAEYVRAAQTVPDVVNARCFLRDLTKRVLNGQIQFGQAGATQAVQIANPFGGG